MSIINAASCDFADVEAAVNFASDGDTVQLPAGTGTWTDQLAFNKQIIFNGAGVGVTTIVDERDKVVNAANPSIMVWTLKPTGLHTLSNLSIDGGVGATSDANNKGIIQIYGQSAVNYIQFNVDIHTTRTSGFHYYNVLGVVANCNYLLSNNTGAGGNFFGCYVFHNSWAGVGDFGDNSWAQPVNWGTEEFLYFENCVWEADPTSYLGLIYTSAVDGWMGHRVVYRYCSFINTNWANHGTESGGRQRGARAAEVYENGFIANDVLIIFPNAFGSRGGGLTVFNNTLTVSGGAFLPNFFAIVNFRDTVSHAPWGICDGSSVWDQDTPMETGYQCLDQAGAGSGDYIEDVDPTPEGWPNQSAEPNYFWDNLRNGVDASFYTEGNVQTGRDVLAEARPDYTPYTYPHPLLAEVPVASVKLYANRNAAPYLPTTFRGGWDKTTGAHNGLLDFNKLGSTINTNSQITNSESDATNPYATCLVRLVTRKLAAQTISGTLDMIMALSESAADANFYTKIFAYATQGDSDTPRGTLLDYEESSAADTEWPTTQAGKGFTSAQTLSSLAISEGDRVVIELGFIAENATATSKTGRTRVGCRTSTQEALDDLVVGSTTTSTGAGHFLFENGLVLSATEPVNVTPETALDITSTPYSSTIDAINIVTPLWYKRTAEITDYNAHCYFSGVSSAGDWTPVISAYYEIGTNDYDYVGGGYFAQVPQKVIQQYVAVETLYYYQIEDLTNVGTPTTRSNVFTLESGPTPRSVTANKDSILITSDASGDFLSAVVDKTTGDREGLVLLVPSENGAVNINGIICLADKTATRLALYNPDFSLITYVVGVLTAVGNHPVCCDGTNFYVSDFQAGPIQVITKISPAGAILDSWTVTATLSAQLKWIAVNAAGTILYYHEGNPSQLAKPILSWDLTLDVALPDFLAGIATRWFLDGLVIFATGDVIFSLQDASQNLFELRRYNAAGVLQDTYVVSSTITAPYVDHIALTTDQLSVWVWFQGTTGGFEVSQFTKYLLLDGSETLVLPNVPEFQEGISDEDFLTEDVPDYYNGIEDSCPLLILDAPENPTNTLIIQKVTVPSGSSQLFDFTGTGISPFSLLDGEEEIIIDLEDGTYSVIEAAVVGWFISYMVSNGNPNTAIVLAGGVTVTVVVTNTLGTGYASGIYEMILGKTEDTIWVVPGVSDIDVKIP